MSEFEQIREALDLTLDEMAEALGTSHASVHRWESAPNTRSGKKGLEAAKALYKKRTKKDWEPAKPPATAEAYADLDRRLKVLEAAFQALAPLAIAVKDLDERVQKLTPRPGSP